MPRVHHVKKARKDNKAAGIKKGDSYYWWQFAFGAKNYSKTPPKPQQLTRSEYLSAMYDLQEQYDGIDRTAADPAEISAEVTACAEQLDEIISELQEKQSNLENAFPNGCPSLETINERIDQCESMKSELEGIASEVEGIDLPEKNDDDTKRYESEVSGILDGMNWEF